MLPSRLPEWPNLYRPNTNKSLANIYTIIETRMSVNDWYSQLAALAKNYLAIE